MEETTTTTTKVEQPLSDYASKTLSRTAKIAIIILAVMAISSLLVFGMIYLKWLFDYVREIFGLSNMHLPSIGK